MFQVYRRQNAGAISGENLLIHGNRKWDGKKFKTVIRHIIRCLNMHKHTKVSFEEINHNGTTYVLRKMLLDYYITNRTTTFLLRGVDKN